MDPKLSPQQAVTLETPHAMPPSLDPGVRDGRRVGDSLLDAVLARTVAVGSGRDCDRPDSGSDPDRFLRASSPWEALALWLGLRERPAAMPSKDDVARILVRDLARIDTLLSNQVNAILHHPRFQRLEASWRGLQFLVERLPEGENIKVRILDVSWRELVRDQERALEFDQSQLFRNVYEEEFGHPGGEPFTVLLGDYEVRNRPDAEHPHDDIGALTKVAAVAAAAFAPFVAGIHPSFLELERFADLERPLDLSKTFEQPDYLKWRAFRQSEDARFVGLTAPRVLMRLPYADDGRRDDGFRFSEEVDDADCGGYLWGTAVYAFGAVLIRAFAESRWFAAIRGVRRGEEGDGLVTGLPVASFGTDRAGVAPRSPTDATITDAQEKELGELGFLPLCYCQDTELAAFYGTPSTQKPQAYDRPVATANARLSSMLQYILCTSRFAHYLKVMSRDKLGTFSDPASCEDYLQRWLSRYTMGNDNGGPEVKARYPLREARVQVREQPDKPGTFVCVAHLQPHFQLDQLTAALRLRTELAPARSS